MIQYAAIQYHPHGDELFTFKLHSAGPIKAGDATAHSHWLVHGAGANRSDQIREVFGVTFYEGTIRIDGTFVDWGGGEGASDAMLGYREAMLGYREARRACG